MVGKNCFPCLCAQKALRGAYATAARCGRRRILHGAGHSASHTTTTRHHHHHHHHHTHGNFLARPRTQAGKKAASMIHSAQDTKEQATHPTYLSTSTIPAHNSYQTDSADTATTTKKKNMKRHGRDDQSTDPNPVTSHAPSPSK